MHPADLLIVAPEWYAPSFNHYFKPSIEQIDYPYDSRSGLIDFSHVWQRASDPAPFERIKRRIISARSARRRVWVVTGRNYLRSLTPADIRSAVKHRQPGPISAVRVGQIRAVLDQLYSRADSSFIERGVGARSDKLRLYLYTP
jgi:hypothetical protein